MSRQGIERDVAALAVVILASVACIAAMVILAG